MSSNPSEQKLSTFREGRKPTLQYDRSKVDLSNCDREPIHIPGSIQPHGAMLVVDPLSHVIVYASDNIRDYLGVNGAIVGEHLGVVMGSQVAHDIANTAAKSGDSHVAGAILDAKLQNGLMPTDATIHRHGNRMFVELEPSASQDDAQLALGLTQSMVRRIDRETNVDAMLGTAARIVRAMLGYDRVMVYRFLHNGAGRVVAEAKDRSLQSFLGQHFPFSDIPVQARALYLRNWIRVIGDVDFVPVPLNPPLDVGDAPVDLSFAHLRSVSPIHCEYLRNMGVAASMSISIVVDGELWGLIACHHNTPKVLSIPLRVATELFAQYFSLHLSAAATKAQHMATALARLKLDAITASITATDDINLGLSGKLREFSSLLDCDGSALMTRGEWTETGLVPSERNLEELVGYLKNKGGNAIWHENHLREVFPGQAKYGEEVAGILAIPVSMSSDSYLFFFRSEEAHTVEWAGEPTKTVVSGPSGDRLTPRGSFDTWREDVRHRSTPWTSEDIAVAEAMRSYVRDLLLHHNERTEEQRFKAEERRNILNAEMNHRVKNILALVKSISAQTGSSARTIDEFTASFEGRLRALSFAHDQSFLGKNGGEILSLLEAEAAMHRFKDRERIKLEGESVGLTERAFGVFALVIHEMMTNAAKYGSLSSPHGRLDVKWMLRPDGSCELLWAESGGPVVTPPSRKGFGSTLIDKTVGFDLGGSAELSFESSGLLARFVIPSEHHYMVVPSENFSPNEPAFGQPLAGLAVMLVEDQGLIALDTEDVLRGLGAAEVRTLPNVMQALQSIAMAAPQCAVLDLNLGQETSEKIAIDLAKRGIPFVFATGYRDSVSIPAQFATVPVVRKPITPGALAIELTAALNK